MFKYKNNDQIHKYLTYTGLLILSCIITELPLSITSVVKAQENRGSTKLDSFAVFSDANMVSGDYSKVVKELCEKTEIGVIHSYRYYKNTGQIKDEEEPFQTKKAKHLLKGLSRIAWSAMNDEMDSKTRLANLRQLVILEKHMLKAKPLGAGNIQIADSVSLLISALIFQEVADSDLDNLDRISPFTQRGILERYYTNQALKEMFNAEINYRPTKTFNSQYDLLISMLFSKHPEFAQKNENRTNVDFESIARYSAFSHKPQSEKSRNPLIDVDPFNLVSDFFVVRHTELCARLSILYRKLLENPDDKIEAFSRLNKELIKNMTDFEKQIYGNPETEEAVNNMMKKIRSQIRNNLKSRGKYIFELTYRRLLKYSEDNDLNEKNK